METKNYINEEWKPIKGYEGLYEISNYGRVKGMKNRVMRPSNNGHGYLRLTLHKNKIKKDHYIHRLVAQTFIPNPNNYPCVNHKDENKANNHVSNLEWCTAKYNSNYGTNIERTSKKNSKPIKCVETDIIYSSASELNKLFGYHMSLIANVCKHKEHYNTAYGYHWEYVA